MDLKPGHFYTVQRSDGRWLTIFEPAMFDNERDNTMTAPTDERTYPDESMTANERREFWNTYLDARTGTYEFRCRRYDAVIDVLRSMGMRRADTIADVGAGRMEFAKRLREVGHEGMYVPIDGSIDGCDLNTWNPPDKVDWAVSIETVEHLFDPARMMARLKVMARYGCVITTPNAEVVDVLAMDPTHQTPLTRRDVAAMSGFVTEVGSLFTDVDDTIIAWWDHRHLSRSTRRVGE